MTLPPGRVFSNPIAAHGCEIQYGLDAPPQTARRLRLLAPDRIEHSNDESRINRRNRHVSECGVSVCPQRRFPLRGMFCIAPGGAVVLDIGRGALGKCDRLGAIQLRGGCRSRFASMGSTPTRRSLRASRAASLAPLPRTRPGLAQGPSRGPCPWVLYRNSQTLWPRSATAEDETTAVAVEARHLGLLHHSRG